MELSIPSLESAEQAWQDGLAEQAFWAAHYAELVQKYPEQFVAVSDGEVVATNPDLLPLIAELESRGLAPPRVWLRFLTTDFQRLIL